MKALTFDIETIPQIEELSDIQQEELQKKTESYLRRRPDVEEEEARKLLMGTSPYFGEIVCIGLYKVEDGEEKSAAITGTEQEILKTFWNVLKKFEGIFISYNGIKFDVPFIVKRSMKHGIKPTSINFLDTKPFKRFPHFDVQNVLADHNRFDTVSLRLACELLGVESPKEEGIAAKDVAEAYHSGRIQDIADYCVRDVKATFEVYKIIKDYL